MTCERARRRAAERAENAVIEHDGSVEGHLEACRPCRDWAEGIHELRVELSQLGQEEPDPAELEEIHRAVLSRLESGGVQRRRWLAWGLTPAAIAGLAALGLWPLLPPPPPVVEIATPSPRVLLTPERNALREREAPAREEAEVRPGMEPTAPRPAREPEIKYYAENPPAEGLDAEGSGVILELASSNPNVVIYWVLEPEKE